MDRAACLTHELIARDIDAYLAQNERKELLRFLTAGSVDDGKSTLIGRLLHDSKMVYEDQLAAVKRDSEQKGSAGGEVDLSLLMDGLKAEREQGITIDVAYRYFSTSKRKFIIADTPGHEQYTRNMATGASTCNLAIILIDARYGMMPQTRRHSFIVSLLGIKHVVVAINKMDLVDFSQEVFEKIKNDYTDFATKLEMGDLHFIPLSALKGDNVVDPSTQHALVPGRHADALPGNGAHRLGPQPDRHAVSRCNTSCGRISTSAASAGTIASGVLRKGDEVMAVPSGRRSTRHQHRHLRRRTRRSLRPDVGHRHAGRRDRRQPRRHAGASGQLAARRPVDRGHGRLDGRRAAGARQAILDQAQTARRHRHGVSTLRYRVDVNTLHRQDCAGAEDERSRPLHADA